MSNPRLRSILAIASATISLAAGHAVTTLHHDVTPQREASRPDIVILLTDQQRADAFGAAGAADIQTPAMDRLARQGVLFTRAFVATPQCSPSRAALLTGRYPHRTGVLGNTVEGAGQRAAGRAGGDGNVEPPAGMSGPLDRSIPTLGRIFGAAGYDTAYFGKWHLGGTPGDYGFEMHDARIDDATLGSRVVAYLQKRAAKGTVRPLLLIVSWLSPHDIYGVLSAHRAPPTALAKVSLPANLVDDLRAKPRSCTTSTPIQASCTISPTNGAPHQSGRGSRASWTSGSLGRTIRSRG